MSIIFDFAIGLSLVNGISGQIQNIISDFCRLDGVLRKYIPNITRETGAEAGGKYQKNLDAATVQRFL